jgi:RimJ/RimL family protein N-acetyltransferase
MKAYKYGIMLERLKESDIELIRVWRNSDQVRLNMQYREIITPEQQKEWYSGINNLSNNYMLIYYKGEKIGLLNDKNIDWESRTSESGIFIGETQYHNTFVPYFISIAGIELNFHFLNWNKQYAHILRSNPNAARYNVAIGYRLCAGQEEAEIQLYEMTRESYEACSSKISKAVRILATDDILPKIVLEEDDYKSGLAAFIEPLLINRPEIIVSDTNEGRVFQEVAL